MPHLPTVQKSLTRLADVSRLLSNRAEEDAKMLKHACIEAVWMKC